MGYLLLFILIIVLIYWIGKAVLRKVFEPFRPGGNSNGQRYRQQQQQNDEANASKNKQFEKSEGKYIDYEEITD